MIDVFAGRDGAYDGPNMEKYNYMLLLGLYDVLYATMEPKPICWRFGDKLTSMVMYNEIGWMSK